MEKVLITATTAYMIGQFNLPNIRLLQELGCQVEVACNFQDRSVWDQTQVLALKGKLERMNVECHDVRFSRSPLDIRNHIRAFEELERLMTERGPYKFLHCHTPIAGALSRMAAERHGIKAIYSAHGFHFYKGAPWRNWLFYFPVEWVCSFWTNILITINREDYQLAKRRMRAKRVAYVPGAGIDLKCFHPSVRPGEEKEELLKEFGLPANAMVLISVGELNRNKNHEAVIRGLSGTDQRIHYLVAGRGSLEEYLRGLSEELGLMERVHFLGYREDIERLYQGADICVLPSWREGLSVSLLEAMASGLPAVCSKVRGNVDLIEEGKGGYLCNADRPEEFRRAICHLVKNEKLRREMGRYNREKVKEYSAEKVETKMRRIYIDCLSC